MLLAPRGLFPVHHNLRGQGAFDGLFEGFGRMGTSGRIEPGEVSGFRLDIQQQLHDAGHDVIVESDGIHIGTSPAASGALLGEDVVQAFFGTHTEAGYPGCMVDLGEVFHLRKGAVVIKGTAIQRIPPQLTHGGLVDVCKPVQIFRPSAVFVLIAEDIVGDGDDFLGGETGIVTVAAIFLFPVGDTVLKQFRADGRVAGGLVGYWDGHGGLVVGIVVERVLLSDEFH